MKSSLPLPLAKTSSTTRFGICLLAATLSSLGHAHGDPHKSNTLNGGNAGAKLTSGKHNTADGFSALKSDKKGSFNTAVGSGALKKTRGSSNVAVGFQALFKNKKGQFNVAIGDGAMKFNVSGHNNVALGMDAGALTTGSDNILIDHKGIEGESGKIRIGTPGTHTDIYLSGVMHGNGSGLTGVVAKSVSGNVNLPATSGAGSGVIGQDGSSLLHTFGTNNLFVGKSAGNFSSSGGHNTAIGSEALHFNTAGFYNTATGYAALYHNTTGAYNTASGYHSLYENTTGSSNTAHGFGVLGSNTSGAGNTASGRGALGSNTTGYNNVAIGFSSLVFNTTGFSNTAAGRDSLFLNTTGDNNTAGGTLALYSNSTGSGNVASGRRALYTNTTGINNTAVGYNSDVSSSNLTNATAVGYNAKVNASNKIRLGNSSVTVIEGQVAYTFTSDRTQKENFLPVDGAEVLTKLRDIEFTSWNYIGQDEKTFRHYGVMAQDFHAAFGQDAVGSIGSPVTVNSGDMAGIMMCAIKELAVENASLKSQLSAIEARLVLLENAPLADAPTLQAGLRD
jgi:trimeric autotransporter adhesin